MLKEANKVAKSISEKYLEEGKDPTKELAKVASQRDWSPRKVKLVSNNLNTKIISGLHKEAARGDKNPHFTYPTVETEEVVKMMKTGDCRSSASVPKPQDQTQLDKIFPDTSTKDDKSKVTTLDTDELDNGDLDFISRVVDKIKNLLRRKRSKKASLDHKINSMKSDLKKRASRAIMAGQPAEILDHLPLKKEKMMEKVSSMGVDIKTTEQDIQLKADSQLKKMANKIEELELKRDDAIVDMKEAEEKLEYARLKLKNKR